MRVATAAAAAGKGIRWRASCCCLLYPILPVRRNTYTCSRTVRVSSSIYPMSQQHSDDVHPTRPCPPVKRRKQSDRGSWLGRRPRRRRRPLVPFTSRIRYGRTDACLAPSSFQQQQATPPNKWLPDPRSRSIYMHIDRSVFTQVGGTAGQAPDDE